MAKRGSISIVEQHIEKVVLGLAVLGLLAMVALYLVMEPNTVMYNGQEVGPGELAPAIVEDAERLQRAVQSASVELPPIPEYSNQLEEQFEAGVFAADESEPEIPREIRVVAQYNEPLPMFEDLVEVDDVELVTPLPPTPPVVQTGISLAYETPLPLDDGGAGIVNVSMPSDQPEPEELSWVTVGAYFPARAQRAEMTQAQYAGYLSQVYIVGADVQRQEMTASGDFSDWEDVPTSDALPEIDLPDPVFDDRTGEVVNQAELDSAYAFVKSYQQYLMQPPFYPIEAGSEWTFPPLPGHETLAEQYEGEEEEEEDEPVVVDQPRQPRGGGGMRPPGGGGMRPPGGGGMRPPGSGGGRRPPTEPDKDANAIAREDLKKARKLLAQKDLRGAMNAAEDVMKDTSVRRSYRRQAERLYKIAQRRLDEMENRTTGPPPRAQVEFITSPETNDPAVWVHDDSVEPGKTYRYRMRVKLWNRYAGRRSSLKNPEDAEKTVITGEWSLPSVPVTVAPKRHFFVRGPRFGEPAASVDVFTWYKGNWLRETFDVRVGEVIGDTVETKTGEYDEDLRPKKEPVRFSTGAIVLDIRMDEPVLYRRSAGREGEFAYRDTESLVLVYLDPADGQVKERLSDTDRSDPLYDRLKEEYDDFRDSL